MPYPDGLPAATGVNGADLLVVTQGSVPGIPGSGTPRKATLSQVVGIGTVAGPGVSTPGNAAIFNGDSGNLLADAGAPPFLLSGGIVTGLAQFTASGEAVDIGSTAYLIPTGGDDSAMLNAALAKLTAGTLSCVRLRGHFQCASALATVTLTSRLASIIGEGVETTSIIFTSATDGLNIILARTSVGATWGCVSVQGMSIIRGVASPAAANTGFSVTASATALSGESVAPIYTGYCSFRDLVIRGNFGRTTQWQNSMVLTSLTGTTIDGLNIQAPGAGATDAGDVLLTITGTSFSQFTTAISATNVVLQGGSCGLSITGYMQGVFFTSPTIIGQYDGVRIIGYGSPSSHVTTGATSGGTVLQFASGSLIGVNVGDIVLGSTLPTGARVTAVNNTSGQVTIAITVTVSSGTALTIQPYSASEDVGIIGGTFNACHRCIYMTWGSLSRVIGATFIRFPNGYTGDYAAIEFNESNDNKVSGNTIFGSLTGTETGVLFSSNGSQGQTPSICAENFLRNLAGPGVHLQGTTANTVAALNNAEGTASVVVEDIANANQLIGNVYNLQQGFVRGAYFQFPSGGVVALGGGVPTAAEPSGSLFLRSDVPGLYIADGGGVWTPVGGNGVAAVAKFFQFSDSSVVIASGPGVPTQNEPSGSQFNRTDGTVGARVYISAGGGTWNAVAGV